LPFLDFGATTVTDVYVVRFREEPSRVDTVVDDVRLKAVRVKKSNAGSRYRDHAHLGRTRDTPGAGSIDTRIARVHSNCMTVHVYMANEEITTS